MSKASSIIQRARPDILAMKPYFSARNVLPPGQEVVFLDASELPCEPLPETKNYRLYGAQQPPALIRAMAGLFGVEPTQVMAARGADEAIDILIRTFCEPKKSNIIICPPTFPMYAQFAKLQGIEAKNVPLRPDFSPDAEAILAAADDETRIVFVCSPNNPTGNTVDPAIVKKLCTALPHALVVVDEAYIDFCPEASCQKMLAEYENLALLRSLSKGYALAGVRCGGLIARAEVVELCTRVLAPYPLPVPVAEVALKTLEPQNIARLKKQRAEVLETLQWFAADLAKLPGVEKVFPSRSNFLLVRVKDAAKTTALCQEKGFIVRDVSAQPGLNNCLRISMGTPEQMKSLLQVLA
jgi:histidinol-phosphate aminotransferase